MPRSASRRALRPWRPSFRPSQFEQTSAANCGAAKRDQGHEYAYDVVSVVSRCSRALCRRDVLDGRTDSSPFRLSRPQSRYRSGSVGRMSNGPRLFSNSVRILRLAASQQNSRNRFDLRLLQKVVSLALAQELDVERCQGITDGHGEQRSGCKPSKGLCRHQRRQRAFKAGQVQFFCCLLHRPHARLALA